MRLSTPLQSSAKSLLQQASTLSPFWQMPIKRRTPSNLFRNLRKLYTPTLPASSMHRTKARALLSRIFKIFSPYLNKVYPFRSWNTMKIIIGMFWRIWLLKFRKFWGPMERVMKRLMLTSTMKGETGPSKSSRMSCLIFRQKSRLSFILSSKTSIKFMRFNTTNWLSCHVKPQTTATLSTYPQSLHFY